MRILLVAYEFPPSPSPQSLRWAYLARELAARGHDVHVLAPDLPGDSVGLPRPGEGVFVHRISAGPMIGLVARRAKLSADMDVPGHGALDEAPLPERTLRPPDVRLNWKGRLFHWVKAVAGFARFPDIRGEWTRGAKRALAERIAVLRPDIVITSHEPASTLELGLQVARAGVPWLADLGDPVLAPYTPWRWRRRARSLERTVWRTADVVTVTTEATAELLQRRHGAGRGPCVVLPQGYDAMNPEMGNPVPGMFRQDRLELLYTGSFYRFREPGALVDAIVGTPGVRLTIASMRVPQEVVALAERHPESLRLLGFLPHAEVLALQRAADVLVNIGNLDPCQIPGKFFEYLGSGRPVLHLGPRGGDHAGDLLQRAGAGWVCENDGPEIAAAVAARRDDKGAGRLGASLTRDEAMLARYRWDRIAEACEAVLAVAVQSRHVPVRAEMHTRHRDIGAV